MNPFWFQPLLICKDYQRLALGSLLQNEFEQFSHPAVLCRGDVVSETRRLLGQVPIEVYGSSETGGIAWRQQQTAHEEKWSPLPNVKWRIDAKEGVLEIRSAHLPDAEWFRTADRARPAGKDHFLLMGRVDRIVKVEGKRIALNAIEERLTASPLARDARAVVLEGRRLPQSLYPR